jgi:hypothetical protein
MVAILTILWLSNHALETPVSCASRLSDFLCEVSSLAPTSLSAQFVSYLAFCRCCCLQLLDQVTKTLSTWKWFSWKLELKSSSTFLAESFLKLNCTKHTSCSIVHLTRAMLYSTEWLTEKYINRSRQNRWFTAEVLSPTATAADTRRAGARPAVSAAATLRSSRRKWTRCNIQPVTWRLK